MWMLVLMLACNSDLCSTVVAPKHYATYDKCLRAGERNMRDNVSDRGPVIHRFYPSSGYSYTTAFKAFICAPL